MQTNLTFITQLKEKLSGTLPSYAAHDKMASENRKSRGRLKVPADARLSAVLILLSPLSDGDFKLPLILRPQYDGVHSGQMAFPGGKKDEDDESLIYTALRECYEEIGVTVNQSEVLGTLSDLYIPPSNMLVTPVVAYTEQELAYIPDVKEVDRVIESSITHLQNPDIAGYKNIEVRGKNFKTPFYDVEGQTVWGATAMMISEFLTVIDDL